jgi:glycosyltransferase involved in cell wall biosynthesis
MSRTFAVMGRVLDQRDGLGLYCINLLRHMVALDQSTRYILLLRTPEHAADFQEFTNAQVHILSARGKLWWDQVSVLRAARRFGADVIFNPKFSVPLFAQRPCAFVLQDSDWYVNPGNYPWWDNLYIRLLLPLYCRKAQRLLSISSFTLADLARKGVVRPDKATVIHAGIAPNFTSQRDEQALQAFRARHQLPEGFILTVARAYHTGHANSPPYPGGNVERMLQAYRAYRSQGGDLPLVVAGTRVREYLQSRGWLESQLTGVHFIGFVPNEQMHLAYQLAQFVVLTKLCESFGLPIVEAMACGCPTIVPRTCACPEVAGGAARLIDPFDERDIARALLEVAASPSTREKLQALGLVRAQSFSWTETARRAVAVLHELPLQGANRRPRYANPASP